MRLILVFLLLAATLGLAASSAAGLERTASSAPTESSHRHGCHRHHTCPSDHATYRWRGLLCVKPTSDKRNSTFKRRVVYAGLTYYCKR